MREADSALDVGEGSANRSRCFTARFDLARLQSSFRFRRTDPEEERMSRAIVDPAELRRFAHTLKHFNNEVGHHLSVLQGQFAGLGDTWRDQEHDKFATQFADTIQVLSRFM